MSYTSLAATPLLRYLERIGFTGKAQPDLATLQSLHLLHPCAITFENLDSWCGITPSLDEEAVFNKLVMQQRGGYCFEHNQLFLRVLQTIGFNVHTLSARVVTPDETPLPRTHKVLLALVNGDEWLVDVGFGGMTMTAPLRLADASGQTTPHEPWRLQADGAHYLLSACVQQQWSPKYRFSLERQTRKDYEMGNWYVATHPESRFRNDLIAARVDQGGRHALINNRYSYHRHGQSSEQRELQTAAELQTVLQQTFALRTSGLPGLDARITGLFADKQQAPAP
jgi:N-hydroxyarylamine O-acetyltransferase